jgi:hypothetical protein
MSARTKAKRRRAFIIWQRNTLQSGLIRTARQPGFFVGDPYAIVAERFMPHVLRHGAWMRETGGML